MNEINNARLKREEEDNRYHIREALSHLRIVLDKYSQDELQEMGDESLPRLVQGAIDILEP